MNNKDNRRNQAVNPHQEYPGQPYYDENGILHYPQTDDVPRTDPYADEYQRQLEEYSRLMGSEDTASEDLQFHSMDEAYRSAQPRQAGTQSRRTQSSAERQKRPQNTSHRRTEELKFGSNNHEKSKGKSRQTDSKPKKSPKKNTKADTKKKGKKVEEKQAKKSHPVRTFFKILILLAVIVFIAVNLLLYRYVSMVNVRERGQRSFTGASLNDKAVTNILVIGSDTRDESEYGRTDSMILLSVNKNTKEITMTSFMRDMYVEIYGSNFDGEPVDFWDKMNAAYVYGGAELLMDTIEYNFDISVDDYVYIDFFSFVDIVNAVGGIEIEISDEEAYGMRAPMGEQNKILGNPKGTDYLSSGGKINMNGNQALAYARLRYVGNADFERTERQRLVIGKIIEKVKTSGISTLDSFAKSSLSNLSTNMSKTDMMLTAYKALFSLNYDIKQLRLPDDDSYTYGSHNGQSTLDVDFDRCREILREEIYKK